MKDPYVFIAQNLYLGYRLAPWVNDGPSPAFVDFLRIVYTREEARLLVYLSPYPRFKTVLAIALESGLDEEKVEQILDAVHQKNGVVKMGNICCLPAIPILLNITAGMSNADFDEVQAAKLHREFFIKDGFSKYYQTSDKGTPSLRTLPVEMAISPGEKVLKSEEAHELIECLPHDDIVLVPCPCRTRKEQLGERECKEKHPVGCCIFLGLSAIHMESVGVGRRVTKAQAIAYFDEMQKYGLVGTTDNTLSDNIIICLCCGCCCSHLGGRIHWGNPTAVAPSNFVPKTSEDCVFCGKCVKRCFMSALTVDKKNKTHVVDMEKCIGCGVCALACPKDALKLVRVEQGRAFKSADALHKVLARENGRTYL